MKFITEGQLREQYQQEPFTSYSLSPETKLTPGAKQFLTDRKISIGDLQTAAAQSEEIKQISPVKIKFQWILSLFLLTISELILKEPIIAHEVTELEQYFRQLYKIWDLNGELEMLSFKSCSGFHDQNWSEDLGDCFEITPYHLQLEKGHEIVRLHFLRSSLRELTAVIENSNHLPNKQLTPYIYQGINRISQLICSCMGGDKCQR